MESSFTQPVAYLTTVNWSLNRYFGENTNSESNGISEELTVDSFDQ